MNTGEVPQLGTPFWKADVLVWSGNHQSKGLWDPLFIHCSVIPDKNVNFRMETICFHPHIILKIQALCALKTSSAVTLSSV